MKRLTSLCVPALCAISTLLQGASFPLSVRNLDLNEARSSPGGHGGFGQVTLVKPAHVNKTAKAVSARPLYCQLYQGNTADGRAEPKGMAFMLDESRGTGTAYDRLIVDLNDNGDLSDDPVLSQASSSESHGDANFEQAAFGPIELPEARATGPWRPRFFVEVYLYNKSLLKSAQPDTHMPLGQLRVYAANFVETTVELNGARERWGFIDGNCNFRLGDRASSTSIYRGSARGPSWYLVPGDYLLRDRDGSGRFERSLVVSDAEILSRVVYSGALPYLLDLDPALGSVRVEPYSDKVAELQVVPELKQLVLGWQGPGGAWEALTPAVASGKAVVPEGAFRLVSCIVGARNANGQWLAAVSSEMPDREFRIECGQSHKLKLGPPLALEITNENPREANDWELTPADRRRDPKPTLVDINVSILGSGGERYARFYNETKMESLPPPSFEIVGPENQRLASGTFEFG